MKIKFSTCIKILILLAIIAYGFYVYWINTDHSKKTKVGNASSTEQVSVNQVDALRDEYKNSTSLIMTSNVTPSKSISTTTYTNENKANVTSYIAKTSNTIPLKSSLLGVNNSSISNQVIKLSTANTTDDNENAQSDDSTTSSIESEEESEGLTEDDIADYIDNSDVLSEFDEDITPETETFSNESKTENNPNSNSDSNSNNNESSTENENSDNPSKSISDYIVEKLNIHATSALLMDASNNRVLYEKNGFKEMPMASTTKIMTLIVTLENANLNDTVTVSKYAASMPDVQLGIRKGEKYKLGDLVYSLMLESHNDVAVAIAEHVGGSVEGFAKMMNTKAKELGCEHTNFVTPNGLDADNHYTTAEDLARIGSYAIKNKEFIKITNTASHSFKELTNGRTFTVTNKDRFLYLMDGAIGIKTGFTNKAGYCFVGALEKDGKKFVSVVLASGWPPNKSYKWQDTKLLMKYGLDHFEMKNISGETKAIGPIKVSDGQEGQVSVAYKSANVELLLNEKETSRIEYSIPKTLTAPVHKNEVVGYITYYVDDQVYKQIPVFTTKSVKKIDLKYCIKKVLSLWIFE